MSLMPTFGVPVPAAGLETLSRDLFAWDAAYADWSPDATDLIALTGHVGAWARGATLATVYDALGATYTAVNAQPAWEQRDWDNDSTREAFGLRMGTADTLAFPNAMLPMAQCGLLEMIETGARTSASACLLSHRNDGASGAGWWLDTSGTYYRFNYRDGSTTRTATLSSGQPASGDRVRFYWQIAADGAVTFYQSINGAAATSASSSALSLPAAWASGCATRLNSNGTGNIAQGWYRRLRVKAGTLDTATLFARF